MLKHKTNGFPQYRKASLFCILLLGSFKTFTLDTVIEGMSYLVFLFPVVLFLLLARIIKIPLELYCIDDCYVHDFQFFSSQAAQVFH